MLASGGGEDVLYKSSTTLLPETNIVHKQIAHPPHPTSNGPPLVVTTEDERNKHYFTWHLFTSLATKRNLDSGSWVVIQCYNFSFQESRFQWIRKCYQTKILQVSYIILKGYWQKKKPRENWCFVCCRKTFRFVDEVLCLVLFRTVYLQLHLHCKTLTETDVLYKSCDFGWNQEWLHNFWW